MPTALRKWLPIALCCVPGIAIAGLVGISLAVGGTALGAAFGGPLGLAVIGVAVLACPVSMGLMMLRQHGSGEKSARAAGTSLAMADCCLPAQPQADTEAGSLATLRGGKHLSANWLSYKPVEGVTKMKLRPQDWRKLLKLWAPPLIGIPVMLLLASLFEIAQFLLFMHHIFWIVSAFLLINPVSELFWPSVPREIRGRPTPRRSAKARVRAVAHKSLAKPWPASETRAERLDRLQRDKDSLDRRIEKLANKEREQSR